MFSIDQVVQEHTNLKRHFIKSLQWLVPYKYDVVSSTDSNDWSPKTDDALLVLSVTLLLYSVAILMKP